MGCIWLFIGQGGRLPQERITNRRADELEAGASQGFAQRIRLRSLGGDFGQRCPGVLDRCPTDEGPQEIAERLPPGGQRQIGLGILDGGGDLGAVAEHFIPFT